MPRLFQTRKVGERPVYPEKTIEVYNPVYIIEAKVDGQDLWLPLPNRCYIVYNDAEASLLDSKDKNFRISIYQRVSENG